MASITVVTDTDGDRPPLLHDSQPESGRATEYSSLPAEEEPPTKSLNEPKQRLVSLDVFRGLTVALMILVDDAGKAFPSINHAPWFGVTLADFVMPFFLFGVGVSVSLVFKKVANRLAATKKVLLRFIRLFLLGVILQGGYFHGRDNLTYGIDLERIRVMGVLQRIAIGYLLVSILEIWLVNNVVVNSVVGFLKRYSFQIGAGILLALLYMGLLYGLYVPSWTIHVSNFSMLLPKSLGASSHTVHCGSRGSLEPPCNAVGFIDRIILGEKHLYQRPVYRRTRECSVNSPDYGPPPPNSPAWCMAPFDPEGILSGQLISSQNKQKLVSKHSQSAVEGRKNKSAFFGVCKCYLRTVQVSFSLMAAITCFVGLHYGHILVHCKGHREKIIFWFISSLPLLVLGYLLTLLGVPYSKPLYTLSYMFITAGASGVVLTAIYFIVDIKAIQKPTVIFQWMGMNALIVYALAACDIFPAALQGLYWRSPEDNLVDFFEKLLQSLFHSQKWGTLVFVMVEILFWGAVAGFLHRKRTYIKF